MSQLRRRIVLFDDHDGSRFATRYLLRVRGHDCEAVASTPAVFAAIDTFRPDLIIYEWYTRCEERMGLSVRFREYAATRHRVKRGEELIDRTAMNWGKNLTLLGDSADRLGRA